MAENPTSDTRAKFWFTEWIPVLSVLGVAVVTALLWRFGPAPFREVVPKRLWPEQAGNALQESTDKLILLSWWAMPVLIVLAGIWASSRPVRSKLGQRSLATAAYIGLATTSLAVVTVASLWRVDGWGYWRGISTSGIVGGLGITVLALVAWRLKSRINVLISLGLIAAVSLFFFPTILETANHLRDPYDFGFTGDELSAPAAGRWPLAGYVPQYTNLLGYPIAPLISAFPSWASALTVNWILLLQLLTIAGAVAVPVIVSGRRMLGASCLLVVAPLMISGNGTSQTPLSYFANMPLRTVLPIVLIVYTLALLPRISAGDTRLVLLFPLGLLSSVTALNNADFGIPAVLVVGIALVLSLRSWGQRWQGLIYFLAGLVSVPLLYFGVLYLTGNNPHPADYLLYARTFAIDGFYQEPMDAFGLHIAATALFVSATSTGAWLVLRTRGRATSFAAREGLALLLSGGWALLTMAYFAGRSLVPTFIGGVALQIGLVAAAYLPLIRTTIRRNWIVGRSGKSGLRIAFVFSVLMMTIVSSLLWQARKPVDAVIDYLDSGTGSALEVNGLVLEQLRQTGAAGLESGDVVQMLPWAGLTQLEAGISSPLVFNSPEVFSISPIFVTQQCEIMEETRWSSVLIDFKFVEFLARETACSRFLDFSNVKLFQAGERTIAAVPKADIP